MSQSMSHRCARYATMLILFLLAPASPALALSEQAEGAAAHAASLDISTFWILPFALMLLSIAVLPLVKEHWWEENLNKLKVAIALSIPVLIYFGFFLGHEGIHKLEHSLVEYFQFIALLGSLFIISGGILVGGRLHPTPWTNLRILGIGAILASFIGTTGAAMLLIRPILKANAERRYKVHTVVFFIFCVANIGGLLTPLGDPPLFLGYLRGVPFTWTFHLWPAWFAMNAILLAIFFLLDSALIRREGWKVPAGDEPADPLHIYGLINFVFLAGVIVGVAFVPSIDLAEHQLIPWREILFAALVFLSLQLTGKGLRERNQFSYHAIIEVAFLFIGIFITMVPALVVIDHMARSGQLPMSHPWQFFWFTGSLSSFLDNAPTYVTFFEAARGVSHAPFVAATGVNLSYLVAVSLGSVFMGANTYIGNGPNFMVKAIAESQKVRMPSFFGYLLWSGGILIPLFLIMTLIMNALEWTL